MRKGWRRWAVLALGQVVSLLVAGAALAQSAAEPEGPYPQTLLKPAGPQAETLYEAMAWDIAFITFIGVIASIVTAFILIRFKDRGEDRVVPQTHGDPRYELVAWLVLIVGLVVMALHPLPAEAVFERQPEGEAVLQVNVIGHQWWWEFEYPQYGVYTANELHIPVGKKVAITTWSEDVIHAFEVPRLGGKNDSLPGRKTRFWIEADKPGVYQGQCFELCGASHARMLTRVIAHPQDDFDAWLKKQGTPAPEPTTDLAAKGKQVFNTVCTACHTVDGTKRSPNTGAPNLAYMGARTSIGGGVLKNTPENLLQWLRDPQSVKPGAKMTVSVKLGSITEDDAKALVEYLESLK